MRGLEFVGWVEPFDFAHDRLRDTHQLCCINETMQGTMGISAKRLNPSYKNYEALSSKTMSTTHLT